MANSRRARFWVGVCLALYPALAAPPSPLVWRPWSSTLFRDAQQQHRFVILDLEAVWCHWCHVMAETTYKDPSVVRLLQARYLTIRVDQDSRPDLSNRYEDYGWPATIVFDERGHEIVKRQGYIPPRQMASMLQAITDDPTPGPSVEPEARIDFSGTPLLSDALRRELRGANDTTYDGVRGGWGHEHKYFDAESLDYELGLAERGDAQAGQRVRQTLTAALALIDPVWGGAYQYSVSGKWDEPHYEKILSVQADSMRLYAHAFALYRDPAFRKAALDVHRYMRSFLLDPAGAFYTSQDADLVAGQQSDGYFRLNDKARRAKGIPRIDRHLYARENGWMVEALVALYAIEGTPEILKEAVNAAQWVVANRALPNGGFRHSEKDAYGPFLGDSLAMARAFLSLYQATADAHWLAKARETGRYIDQTFAGPGTAGYLTSRTPDGSGPSPNPQRGENIALARFANLTFYYTGDRQFRAMAERAMRFLVTPPIARRLPAAAALLADQELTREPLHITILGRKQDPAPGDLFRAALQYPGNYKRLEWWDRQEGNLPNPDVPYPNLSSAAAFLCTDHACSSPIHQASKLAAVADRTVRRL